MIMSSTSEGKMKAGTCELIDCYVSFPEYNAQSQSENHSNIALVAALWMSSDSPAIVLLPRVNLLSSSPFHGALRLCHTEHFTRSLRHSHAASF